MAVYFYNDNLTDQQKALLTEYYRHRSKIIKRMLIILIVLAVLVGGGLAFCYVNHLLMFSSPDLELILKTDKPITIGLSEIDDFKAEDYIKTRTEENTTLYIPDIEEVRDSPATYELEYALESDKTGDCIKTYLTVEVVDDISPVLTLTDNEIEVKYGSDVNLKKYIESASDNIDGENLVNSVEFDSLDTKKAGTRTVTYSLEDSAGNVSVSMLKVTVKEKESEKKSSNKSSDSSSSSKKKSSSSNSSDSSKSKSSSSKSSGSSGNSSSSSSKSKKSDSSSSKSSTSSSSSSSSSSGSSSSSSSKKSLDGKKFLYADGYDVSNVMNACKSTLSEAGVSGSCVPIYEDGIVIGAKIVVD